jgi:glycosyltransferase involved in cell wall biosynthesis
MVADTKVKVMLIASFPESIIAFRGALISEMVAQGLGVHVAAPGLRNDNPIRRTLKEKGVFVHDIPLERTGVNPVSDLGLLWILIRLLRRTRPDCVIGYTIKPVIYGSLAAWLVSIPHRFALVTGLGYAFTQNRGGLTARLVHGLYRFALRKVEKVFFQNPDDEAFFREKRILAETTPSVIVDGSGVDLAAFTVEPIPDPPMRFLMIARLLGDKGVREYVKAASHIRGQYPNVEFGLVGWIDENPDAISETELDVWVADGAITYFGRLDDVRPAIANCRVYVLPSYREGTPRTVLEAMAMGRPIITTDAPGCRETVIDGENGFLIPVKSVDALIEAMQKFIDDPRLAERMGKRSRQIAEKKYDVHKINAVMLREMGFT